MQAVIQDATDDSDDDEIIDAYYKKNKNNSQLVTERTEKSFREASAPDKEIYELSERDQNEDRTVTNG